MVGALCAGGAVGVVQLPGVLVVQLAGAYMHRVAWILPRKHLEVLLPQICFSSYSVLFSTTR